MIIKDQRINLDRRGNMKRRVAEDPNYNKAECRKILCIRSGKNRRIK